MVNDFFKTYGESLIYITIALVGFVFTHGNESYGPNNSQLILGVLSEAPRRGGGGETSEYIDLRIIGYKDVYKFSSCSYSKRIVSVINKLAVGDSVTLYVSTERSSITFPWVGEQYGSYNIFQASSPRTGTIISFEQYNGCGDYQRNTVFPFFCAGFMLLGLYRFFRAFKDKQNARALNTPRRGGVGEGDEPEVIALNPDRLTFVLRNSLWAWLFIAMGVYVNYPFDINHPNYGGLFLAGFGLYVIIRAFSGSEKTFYAIEREGIRLYGVAMVFKSKTSFIHFSTIKEVTYRQAFYEIGRDIGTVFIDHGETDSDNNKIYTKLIGLSNYQEIARIIMKRVEHADTKS